MHHPENALLHKLPPAARQQLLDHCEPFELVLSAELSVRGQPLEHAHFPVEGFLSLVIDVDKAIRVWNQLFPDAKDKIKPDANTMAQIARQM